MIKRRRAGRDASQDVAPITVAGADVIRSLYEGILGRSPRDEEVEPYLESLRGGTALPDLVASIAASEEAHIVQSAALAAITETTAPPARPVPPLAIGADDVMETLSYVLALTTGQPVDFDAVFARFGRFRDGEPFAAILGEVLPASAPAVREDPADIAAVVRALYRDILKRTPSAEEVGVWRNVFASTGLLSAIVLPIAGSEEARLARGESASGNLPPGLSVQMAFEIILGRGAAAADVDFFRTRMEKSGLTLASILTSFFADAVEKQQQRDAVTPSNNPSQAFLFGSRGVVEAAAWVDDVPAVRPVRTSVTGSVFALTPREDVTVSILTSLFRGGDYIEAFLENITGQTIFAKCELIIIDACSPEGEGKVIRRYQERFPNIVYKRFDSRIGIYEAWNIAADMARGAYLTNANLDDCRRDDSLEIQAATLDSLPFVDVAYQDVLYSFASNIGFDEIAAHDLATQLPVVSRYNLTEFNCPHNGPMWRRTLHADVGRFNEDYKSAADFDFWLRCLIAGKTFYKSNEPHVAYYVNPQGLSTRADTRGVVEANAISRALYRKIVSPLLTMTDDAFLATIGAVAPITVTDGRRYDMLQAALCELGHRARQIGKGTGR